MQLPYRKPPKFANAPIDPLITQRKFDELQEKLARLLRARPQLAGEVHRLAQNGDFSENAEYQQAKGRLRGMNEEIDRLQYQVDHAEIIAVSGSGEVEIGSVVTVDTGTDLKEYTILGSAETNPGAGVISHTSPIGSALLGKKVGDEIEINLPQRVIAYKIIKIE